MAKTMKAVFLGLVFIILVIAIASLYELKESEKVVDMNRSKSTVVYAEIIGEKEVPSNQVIVNEKFAGRVDEDAKIIVFRDNGQIYDVKSGVVLIDDNYISNTEEGYTVYNINDPEKVVYTN